MNWFLCLLVGLLSGVLGLVCAGVVMSFCVRWYRISSFEGGAGYAVMFTALAGGVAGAILGFVMARVMGGDGAAAFGRSLGWSLGVVLAIAAIAAAIAWALADIPPQIDGQELMLEIEIKLPAGVTAPPAEGTGESSLSLGSVVNHVQRRTVRGELRPKDARREDGRWVVPGSVHLFTSRGLRSTDFQLNGESLMGYLVPLPPRPGPEFETWSEWGPHPQPPNPPWPDSKPSFRFRVTRIAPPPPGPSAAEIEAEEAEAAQADFEAMDAAAPIRDWLPWTRYGVTDEQRTRALANIAGRAALADEVAALILSDDAEIAAETLRLIEHLPGPPACLVAPVERAGRDLAARLRRVNDIPADADPGFGAAAEISVRFSAWMTAVRALRAKCGADLTPELREILVLSRVRTDSQTLRSDVRRVASYWMHEWTGLEPLPGDPSPR